MAMKFTRVQIAATVDDVIWDCLAVKADSPSASLREDLGADSLDIVELAMGLESKFNLDVISDTEAEQFTTPQAMIDFVERRLAAEKAST